MVIREKFQNISKGHETNLSTKLDIREKFS